jgi:hypothetical protein
MYRLGSKVIIVQDSIEQNLPVHEYGYIIAHEKNPDNVFDYVVRLPKLNKNVYVSEHDIELEQVLLEQEAERIQKDALIDYALATNNRDLFEQIMNENVDEEADLAQLEEQITETILFHITNDGTIRREVH